MKKQLLLLTLLLSVTANDYAVEAEINGLWYDLVSETKEGSVIQYKNNIKYSGNVVIPDSAEYNGANYSVTSIGSDAFSGCSGLTSITIPESVTNIGDYAFYSCSGLKEVISMIENPFGIYYFSDETYANATLYVPMGTAEKYKAVEVWNYFASIVEGVENSIAQVREKEELIQAESGMIYVAGTDEGTSISVYSANGVLCGSAVSHNGSAVIGTDLPIGSIAIVKIGNKAVKVVVE